VVTRSKKTVSAAVGAPEVPPVKGVQLLRKHQEAGAKLLSNRPVNDNDYSTWSMLARNYLEKAFGQNSPNVTDVTSVGSFIAVPMHAGDSWWEQRRAQNLETKLNKLNGLAELLETEIELRSEHIVSTVQAVSGYRIFLVHGHDERALHETARFLEKLEQKVVVLREQPNQGRTIVEKFEEYSDVGFAVVLLTGDDLGGPKSTSADKFRDRARQNVVFELGYFNGRLGRNRVCALYSKGVEIPSDYAGVLYIELDENGAWRLQLAKELRAAGFAIDMNDAL
jgi:predicted nucleotide-binding protein